LQYPENTRNFKNLNGFSPILIYKAPFDRSLLITAKKFSAEGSETIVKIISDHEFSQLHLCRSVPEYGSIIIIVTGLSHQFQIQSRPVLDDHLSHRKAGRDLNQEFIV
jgi:hypothetical protein